MKIGHSGVCTILTTAESGVCFGLSVLMSSFCCKRGNIHIWNNRLPALTMCWEKGSDRFWEPLRADRTDYPTLSTFLWPLSSIAHSLNCGIAQCFCKIGGNLWWVEQNRAQEVDLTKFSLHSKQPGRTILGGKIFHICYQIFPYLLSDLAAAIKSLEFIFPAGFDGAILGKKAATKISIFNLTCRHSSGKKVQK